MDYNYLYRKLNNRTPLKTDCGKLCSNACCVDTGGEEMGMYLFPKEEEMFLDKPDFRIEDGFFPIWVKKQRFFIASPIAKDPSVRYPAESFRFFRT